jgi:hypothetical protein
MYIHLSKRNKIAQYRKLPGLFVTANVSDSIFAIPYVVALGILNYGSFFLSFIKRRQDCTFQKQRNGKPTVDINAVSTRVYDSHAM